MEISSYNMTQQRTNSRSLTNLSVPESSSDISIITVEQHLPIKRECILIPSYAFKDPEDQNKWIVRTKGWALSLNKSGPKQKILKGITKTVAGKHSNYDLANKIFDQRFKYFMAKGKKNIEFRIEAISAVMNAEWSTYYNEESNELQTRITATRKLSSDKMTLSNLHDTSLCGLEEDSSSIVNNLEYNLNSVTTHHVSSKDKDCIHNNNNNQSEKKDVNCIAAYNNSGYNRFIPQPITPTISSRKGIGVTLKSAETGAFTGEFQILDEQVQYWIQHANNRYDKRCMLQIRSESTSSSKKEDVLFPPSYCLVQLIEPKGLSVISDIDDTIKVTGVLAGTRSILSNTFFKPTRAVYGMADVYSRWYNHGVAFHYVSNSPFQLIHVLHQFMRNHNFPPGSFHLKNTFTFISKFVETSGRFKVGTICRIIHDFPHRMFVLVGDSSEMDLEIYTQIAIKFPNRILKIFIRDMTSQANMEQMKKKKKNKKKKINNKRRSSTSPSLFSNSTKKQKEDNQRSQSAPIRSNSTPVFTFSQLSKNNKVDDDNEEEEEDDDDDNDEQVASKLANLGFISEENSSTSYNNLSITKSSPDNISSFTDYHPTSSDPLHLYTRVAHARKLLKHVDIVLFKDASELLTDEDILAQIHTCLILFANIIYYLH